MRAPAEAARPAADASDLGAGRWCQWQCRKMGSLKFRVGF